MKHLLIFIILLFFISGISYAQIEVETENGVITFYQMGEPLSSIVFDKNDNMWIGNNHGISKLNDITLHPDSNTWSSYTSEKGLGCGAVYSIAFDNINNDVWIGGDVGISKFDGVNFTNYSTLENYTISDVYVVLIDHNNKKWFGTHSSLLSYDDIEWKFDYSITLYPPDPYGEYDFWKMRSIVEDKNNHLWIGGRSIGISEFDGTSWHLYSQEAGEILINFIDDICVDKNNVKWFVYYYNLFSYNDTTWTDYTDKLPIKGLECITIDENGIIWIGAGNGLIRFDGKKFKVIDYVGGYVFGIITSITVDKNNIKWLGSYWGKDKNYHLVSLDDSNVHVEETVPAPFTTITNYPNPFNPSTTISFTLSEPGYTKLSVYNSAGQKIRELISSDISAGKHSFFWDGKDKSGKAVSSGIYFSVLESGGKKAAGKMMMMK